jgi:hypothetical protein
LKNSCHWDEPINKYQDTPVCAYNLEDFKTLYSQHVQEKGMELDEETLNRVESWFAKKGLSSKYGRNGKTQFIDFPDLKYIFLKYKVACFMVRVSVYSSDDDMYKNRLVLYPYLNHFDFKQVFNALECYQKIDMYLFNQLVPPDVVIHKVPDKIKAESHGFNKFSFRKDKVVDKV